MKGSVKVKKCVEVSLRKTDLKKHGHTRCDLCVEVEGSAELKENVKVKGRVNVKGSVKVKVSVKVK